MRLRAALAALLLALPLAAVGSGAAHAAESPLTASFAGVPSAHDGVSPFSFDLVFSEPASVGYKTLRDDSFDVAGGSVTRARRVDGRSDRWRITVAPDVPTATDAVGDVSIELAATPDCDDDGAVCTADDAKALSNTTTATVAAPPPLVAAFESVPATHDTSAEFSFRLRFDTAVTTSYRILGGTAFDVAGGEVTGARRVEGRSDLWQITIQPDTVGDDTVDDDITITLPVTEDCADADAVCTVALRPLSEPVTASVEGPLVEAVQSIERGQRATRGVPGDKEDEEEDRVGVRAVPDAPANLGFHSFTGVLTLYWDEVVSDPVVTGYEVEYREAGTTPWSTSVHSGTELQHAIMGLDNYTVYEARVRARNGNTDSDLSSWSTIDAAMPVPIFNLGTTNPQGIWSDGTTAWVIDTRRADLARAYRLSDFERTDDHDILVESLSESVNNMSFNNRAWGICSDGTTTWVSQNDSTGVLYAYELNSSNEWTYQSSKNISGNDLAWSAGLWCDSMSLLVAQGQEADRGVWAYALPARTRNTAADITLHSDNERSGGTWANASTVWINDINDHKLYAYARSNGARIEALDLDYSASSIKADHGRGIWSDDTDIWIVGSERRVFKFPLPQRGANTAPTADDGAVTTVENTAYTFDAGDFNFVDTDAGDELDKVKIVTLPTAGTLALDGNTVTVNQEVTKTDIDDDKLTFTPATDSTDSTSFTFKVNDGDDESASAYTMTVNVTAAVVTCAAPTYTGDLRQIWTGALTVGSFEAEGETFYGYNSTTGTLSPATVTVGGDDHPIATVNVGSGAFEELLVFNFTAATAPALSVVRKLVLFACDDGFAMGGFATQGMGGYTLADSGLDWSSETSLNLYIAIDDTAPELLSAKVAGTTLVLTYDEALDEDEAVPTGAFTVTVAGTDVTPTDVEVDDDTVTLTLANEVTAGQTVTLTYTKQAGTPRVRDEFTNEAAALTDQAVGNSTGNTAPTAANQTVETVEGTPYAFDAGDFNFADTDSGDTLEKVKIVTLPDAGTLALSGTAVTVNQEVTKADIDDDNLTFTPVVGANGSPYTTFTFKVNDGDDESASAYTMTVNVAAPSADLLWSATMTVGNSVTTNGNGYFVDGGLVNTTVLPYGALSDDDFSHGTPAVDYVVQSLRWGTDLENGSGSLFFVPDAALPAAAVSSLILQIGTNSFRLEDATVSNERKYKWTGAYRTTTPPPPNSMVSVCLRTSTQLCSGAIVPDTTAPEFTGATVNGAFVEMTYSEDLDDTFGTHPAAAAFTVMVAGSLRTVTDAGVLNRLVSGVTKATVRLKLASPVAAGEAVTVAYTKPATNPVRDVGGNEAVTLTAQDVDNDTVDADLVCGTPNVEGRTQIWTGTVTVASSFATLTQGFNEGPPVLGALSEKTFTVGTNDYTIRSIESDLGSLYFFLTSRLTPADKQALTLHICDDHNLPLREASNNDNVTFRTHVDWTPFTTRNLALSIGHATGAPTILGAAQVGATLRASTAEIADDEGKTKADNGDAGYAYTYQWVRENADGTSPADISGATSSTYPVVAADVGKKLKVKVSFTDDLDNPESLTSEATGVVIVAAATTVTIAADEPAITNALSHMNFTLTRTGDTSAALPVTITLEQTKTSQFMTEAKRAQTWTADFDANDTTADFQIHVRHFRQGANESGEFTATIAPGTDYGVGTPGWATVAVKAAQPAMTVRIERDAYEVDEDVAGGKATVFLVFQMEPGFPAPNTTFAYSLVTAGDGAVSPADFGALSESVSFPPSEDWAEVADRLEARVPVEVEIVNDDLVEADESLNLLLDRTAGAPVGPARRLAPNGDDCPVPEGQTARECKSTLTILDDDVPPMLDTATVNGLSLVLTYDRALDGDSDPAASAYSVAVDGEDGVAPTAVDADGSTVTLTLATAVTSGQSVTLSYTVPTMNPVTDSLGNLAPALVDQAVHNVVGDTTAPELENAQVDGAVLVLTYNEALDPGSTPAVGDFNVQVTPSGGTASRRDVSTVDVSGSKVTLTLDSAVLLSDGVSMAYVVPSSNPLQDVAGNDAAAFSGRSVGHVGTNLPMFPQATLTREITENSAANVNVGEPIPEATGGAEDAMLVYSMEGTDAASFNFDVTTRQITTKTGVTYDHENKPSYEVTIKVTDGTDNDTVVVTIDVKNLPTVSIEPRYERVLLSDGVVSFDVSADPALLLQGIGLQVPVVVTQDHEWGDLDPLSPYVEKHNDEGTWVGYGVGLLRDAPVQGGYLTVTLQSGDDWELDSATSSARVEIVAADPLITVRAEQAGYSVAEDGGTVTVTLIAQTVAGAPKPRQFPSTVRLAWAAAADEATGGGADFRDAGAADLFFASSDFTEEGGRWVLEREVEVTVVDDDVWEFDEEFHIALSRFVEVPPLVPYMHPLVKLANTDGTLCEDNASGVNCGATVTILSSDNAAPVFSSATATREVEENSPADTNVGAPVTATDANTGDGDALTYSLEGTDAASFAIDAATGQITTTTGVDYDYETDPSYSVTVKATDRQDASATIAVTINLTDVDPEVNVCAAPDLAGREQVWTSEMTVGNSAVGPVTLYGFDGGSLSYGSLSDDDFRIGSTTYDVSALFLWTGGFSDGQLTFNVESLPDRGAVLHICDESFTLAQASRDRSGGRDEYRWQDSGLDWSAVEMRNVYLSVTPPQLDSATVDGTQLKLEFSRALDTGSVPSNSDFNVQVTPEGGVAARRTVTDVAISASTATLTLSSAVLPEDTVTVQYSGTALRDTTAIKVQTFDDEEVRNNTLDTTAPMVGAPTVSGAMLVLTYDELLDEDSVPAPSAFEVSVAPAGGTAERRDVTAVAVERRSVRLTLRSRVRPREVVTLRYSVPGSNPLRDLARNNAAAIGTALAVANETGGNRAPSFDGVSWNMPPSFHITRQVAENSGGGVKVGEPIGATDPDGDSLSWSITRFERTITIPDPNFNTGSDFISGSIEWVEWGASAYFTIDEGTGQIRTKSGVDYDYETRRSYFVEVEVTDGLGAVARTDVLIELTDVGGPEDTPLSAPQELTLRKLGPTAVMLSWETPASSATVAKHQFRIGRHPTSVDSVLGGIGPQNPANRVLRDDGWMDFPEDSQGPLGHVLRDSVGGATLIHVWELKVQVRSVGTNDEVSRPSNVAYMPDTAPMFVAAPRVVSEPASNGVYEARSVIAVEVKLDEPVRVRGRPMLDLSIAGTTRSARFTELSHQFRDAEVGWGADEGTIMRFEYRVPAGTTVDPDDIVIPNSVRLNGALVTDATRVGNNKTAILNWGAAGVL